MSETTSRDYLNESAERPPWYVRFTYQFGLPAAIAIYLLSFIVAQVTTQMGDMSEKIDQNAVELAAARVEHVALQGQLLYTNLILQRICVNTSSDQAERNACFNSR